MAQVIENPSLGQLFGSQLSNSIGSGLSGLAQGKMKGMLDQQKKQQFMDQLEKGGFTKQEAETAQLFQKDAKVLLDYLSKLRSGSQGNNSGMAENQGSFGQQMAENQGSPQNMMNNLQNGPQNGMQNLQDILNQFSQQGQQQQGQQQPQQQVVPKKKFDMPKPLSPAEQLARNRDMSPAAARLASQKEKFEYQKAKDAYVLKQKEQQIIDKELKPYADLVNKKGGAAAQETDKILDRFDTLIDSGNLSSPTWYNLIKKLEHSGEKIGAGIGGGLGTAIGLGAGAFLGSAAPGVGTALGAGLGASAGAGLGTSLGTAAGALLAPKFVGSKEDQEFQKLSVSFLDRLKDVFGGRISNIELQTFMDSIPALSQTNEGKKAIIRNMRLTTDGWRHKKQVMDKIISRNGGYKPRNLEQLVEEESAPYMDNLKQQFVQGI